MSKVVLNDAQVRPLVGQVVPAGMPQRVWMYVRQPRVRRDRADQVVDGLPRQGLAALGNEEPRQAIGARGKIALDRPELVAGGSRGCGSSAGDIRPAVTSRGGARRRAEHKVQRASPLDPELRR
jgi:hypothetical protein